MSKMIFVNLPVADLTAATSFYEAIGATRNPQFSDETASSMVFSDSIYVMLLTHAKFAGFTPHPIGDATRSTEVLVCLSGESRAEVDEDVGQRGAAEAACETPLDVGAHQTFQGVSPRFHRSFRWR